MNRENKFDEKQFVEDYNELKSSRKMAAKYGCTKDAILTFAKKIGYVNEISPKLSDEDIQFILDNYDKMTSKELANTFNVTRGYITKIWFDNGKSGKLSYSYPFLFDYFESIDTYDKAYILGLLASDGNVFHTYKHNKQDLIKITLNINDFELLKTISLFLCSKKPICINENNKTATIELVSNKMASDLSKYGIVPQKTLTYITQPLEHNLMSHFFKGYFDGDGSISVVNNDLFSPSKYDIGIVGFETNIRTMMKYLKETHNIDSVFIEDKRPYNGNDKFGVMKFVNIKSKYKFLQYIYKDCGMLYMPRKKYKADCFFDAIKKNYSNKENLYNAVLNEIDK